MIEHSYKSGLRLLFQSALDIIYPEPCPGCQSLSPAWDKSPLCSDCWSRIDVLPPYVCRCCGLLIPALKDDPHQENEEPEELFLCHTCLQTRPFFTRARSAAIYTRTSPVRSMLLALKHGKNLSCLKPLLTLLVEQFPKQMPVLENELVLPVPLHWSRFLERGFNQSAFLATFFAREIGLEFCDRAIVRTRKTPPQSGDPSARQANMKDAFAIRKPGVIKDRNILLIDDVLTTGATLDECARKLRDKGSGPVRAFTVARVVV